MLLRKMMLFSVAAFAGADVAAQAHVPVEYYISTLAILAAITVVLKTWTWVRKEMRGIVTAETLELRHDIQRLTGAIKNLQCVRHQICDDRKFDGPLITPLNLPVVKPDKE